MLIIDFAESLIAVCIACAISGFATLSWPLIAFLNARFCTPAFLLIERLPGLVENRLGLLFYCLHGLWNGLWRMHCATRFRHSENIG